MIRAVIVDDEPLARQLIREYLADFPQVKVVAEAKSGRQAVKVIDEENPDVAFLDIRMPGMDGFEVLESLHHVPRIIFCTAHGDFALKAFEVNAVDYLLKPYDKKRFQKAVQRVIEDQRSGPEDLNHLTKLLQDVRPGQRRLDSIFVRSGRKILPVRTSDILWIESEGDYSNLHTASTSHLCNLSISELERRLDPSQFSRVHRSFIVQTSAIRQLSSDGEGGFTASLSGGVNVHVSRSYAAKIRHLIW